MSRKYKQKNMAANQHHKIKILHFKSCNQNFKYEQYLKCCIQNIAAGCAVKLY